MEVVREECERQLLAIAQQEKRGFLLISGSVHCSLLCLLPAAESDVEMENKRLIAIIDSLRYVCVATYYVS